MQKRFVLLCALLFAWLLGTLPTEAQQWAGSSAITTWNGSCNGPTRIFWDTMCSAWRQEMGSHGWTQWWRNYDFVQGNRYADSAIKWWGIDNTGMGMDWNDAGLMCLHGGWGSGRWTGTLHDKDPEGSCAASSNKMRLGPNSGGWLRFMHLSSCNSMRHDQLNQWFGAAAGVHVVTGFHGTMYIGPQYVWEYSDLADEGMSSRGVGKAWVDDMTHLHWVYNFGKNICAVSVAFGANPAAALNGQNETYNGHWAHPTPSFGNSRWYSGCDPDDGPPLP